MPTEKGWSETLKDEETKMLIHALAIMKYCKEHKKCKGCMFWSDSTACRFRNSSLPKNWQIYGFDDLMKDIAGGAGR